MIQFSGHRMRWGALWMGAMWMTLSADGSPAPVRGGLIVLILVAAIVIAALVIWFVRRSARRPAPAAPPQAEPVEVPSAPIEEPLPPPTEAPVAPVSVEAPPAIAPIEAALAPVETPALSLVETPPVAVETTPPPVVAEVPPAPIEEPLPPPTEAPPAPVETPAPVVEVPPAMVPVGPLPPPLEFEGAPRPIPIPVVPQFLEAVTTSGKLRRFSVDRARLTIGRAPDNDIVISDEFPGADSVANHHARIELREAWVIVEAAGPNAAIFVNGQQTGRNILRNGWWLTLGDCDLTFRTAGLGTAPLSESESMEPQPGARTPRPSAPEGFVPLADGAVLTNRYIVLEARVESPTRNTYVAESLQPVLCCEQCGFDGNEAKQKACRNCGASLADSVPYYPHYHVKESAEEESLNAERQLIGLSHPNALLPRQAFTETPFGNIPRHYILEPEAPQLAATLRVPQEMPQVLEWTQHLAQGMAYLHNNSVSLGPIDLWRIALEGTQARWVDFSACEFVSEEERSTRYAAEVRALAEIAYYLITGKRHYDESIEISPPGVGMVFDRILCGLDVPTADKFAQALQASLIEVRRPSSMDVRVGRLTDVGQVRQLNEDSILTIEVGRVRRSISEPLGLYAVCDGMGGHAAGDVASGLAVQTLARKALAEVMSDGIADDGPPPNWEGWLKTALQEANQAVFGRRRASGNDMGTTCVAALIHGDTATIAHLGDSRCYLVYNQGIKQLTQDHSLVQRLIQLGQLTPEEARFHPQRNVIYKNLGNKAAVEPDVMAQKITAGDRLLLCSDGLNTMVDDDRIRQIVMSASSPQEACHQLIEAANRAGGEDNISVIIVQMEALD